MSTHSSSSRLHACSYVTPIVASTALLLTEDAPCKSSRYAPMMACAALSSVPGTMLGHEAKTAQSCSRSMPNSVGHSKSQCSLQYLSARRVASSDVCDRPIARMTPNVQVNRTRPSVNSTETTKLKTRAEPGKEAKGGFRFNAELGQLR